MPTYNSVDRQDRSATLRPLIRQDQLRSIRLNVLRAAPVNILVSAIVLFVAVSHQQQKLGMIWFSASVAVGTIRVGQCLVAFPNVSSANSHANQDRVEWQLKLLCFTALILGAVWASIPVLCDGYTGPQTLFYLTAVSGITAGAITAGTSYALMPSCMIFPPLLSVIFCLLHAGGLDRTCLAATVSIYMVALIRSAAQSEAGFREASLLKNDAETLARSLGEAHSQALIVAQRMSFCATHDELTGLLNRAGFMSEVKEHVQNSKSSCCLMLLDLDGFKSVNDSFGHHSGDRVLVEVARRLSETLSSAFKIGRLGGDEFAVFYDSICDDSLPSELAMRLIMSIEVPFGTFDVGRLGACVGIYIGKCDNVTEILTCADEALYAAKASGRNRYYIFDNTLRARLEMRRDIERDLQRAVSDDTIEVWYQPVFAQNGRELVSLEALLRWTHPRHGLVPPQELIAAAATAGLAEVLFRFVLRCVCSTIRDLYGRGLQHVRVAMNISPREIARLAVDEIVLSELKKLNCPASMFEIEITEEVALDIRSVQDKLVRLSAGGVTITIDDFGVGYATLAMLVQQHITKIKIDRSFVQGFSDSKSNQILVRSTVQLGHALGMKVVAEGVETEEDHRLLKLIGCDFMQGYYFQRPMPRATLLEFLRT